MKKKSKLYVLLKPIVMFFIRLIYHPKYINKELVNKEGSYIIVINHQSYSDPLLIQAGSKRQIHYFAKIELKTMPFLGFFMRRCNLIFVDRSKKSPETIKEGIKYLEKGSVIGIFPEGTRNLTEKEFLPFKMGAFKMAKDSNKPIIIAVIKGKIRPFIGRIEVHFKGPYDIGKMTLEEGRKYIYNEMLKIKEEE